MAVEKEVAARMKVLLYADFRSPHARGWRDGLVAAGLEVVAVSSELVEDEEIFVPSGSVSRLRQNYLDAGRQRETWTRSMVRKLSTKQVVHTFIYFMRRKSLKRDLLRLIELHQPDLVHALRLPYEGITALAARSRVPVVVSSWGLDFVPQAQKDPILRALLRSWLSSAAGFQYDSPNDFLRALEYGVSPSVPALHAAGNFGVDESMFYVSDEKIPGLVVYARKATANCNFFGFIEAALSLSQSTGSTFVGVGLDKIEREVVGRFGEYDHDRLRLIGELDRAEFARLIRSAHVVVSPSYWEGMPNTVLEAAASGARIVAGDLPQLRELMDFGVDIDLIDASESNQIAQAIERQLSSIPDMSTTALPDQYSRSMNCIRVREFYDAVLSTVRL